MGSNIKSRLIILYLENLTQGQHTFKVLMTMETPVDNGLEVMQPGIQEHTVNFTVAEPEIYPDIIFTSKDWSASLPIRKSRARIFTLCAR